MRSLRLISQWWPWLGLVTPRALAADAVSGVTNAVVVLPQAVAYATLAGLPPRYGLYTAVVPAVVAALAGSSRHLVSGPTAALSIVLFTTVSALAAPGTPEYITLAFTLTLYAGVIQLCLGVARLGFLVNFVSHTVVVGFTAGAALVIAASQIGPVLGLEVVRAHTFLGGVTALFDALGGVQWTAASIGGVTLAALLVSRLVGRGMPDLLVGLVAAVAWAQVLAAYGYEVRLLGALGAGWPPLSTPQVNFATVYQLGTGAIAVALLGLVEALSIARAIAVRSGQRLDGSREFIGQGLSNIFGAYCSSYVSSGSFTRSGVNFDSGARTPLAAVFAAASLLVIILLFSDFAALIPVSAVAGVLLVVAYRLVDGGEIARIVRFDRPERVVLATTFAATLVLPMEFAIYVGVLCSLLAYLRRTSRPRVVEIGNRFIFRGGRGDLAVIRIDGSLFFGAVPHVEDAVRRVPETSVLAVCRGVNFIDLAGVEMLIEEARRRRRSGGRLYLAGLRRSPYESLALADALSELGSDAVFRDLKSACRALGLEETEVHQLA